MASPLPLEGRFGVMVRLSYQCILYIDVSSLSSLCTARQGSSYAFFEKPCGATATWQFPPLYLEVTKVFPVCRTTGKHTANHRDYNTNESYSANDIEPVNIGDLRNPRIKQSIDNREQTRDRADDQAESQNWHRDNKLTAKITPVTDIENSQIDKQESR